MRVFLLLFSVLFPQECEICGNTFPIKGQNYICDNCLNSIYKMEFVYCHSCGKVTSNCQECSVDRKFNDIRVFTRSNDRLTKIIAIYKLKPVKNLASSISSIIFDDITEFVLKNKVDLITYVPLYKKVQRERGFNHLREILVNIFPKKVVKEVLIKIKDTKLQMELSKEERERNLRNAFVIRKLSEIEGKNILIFDDIMTTGNTLLECYKELKKGKPNKIFGYVIAR
ncbi:MAG: ComF family protein [Persephonella sp.]|nr:MAG: ComF family protein [Persephonella sp.]